MCEELSAVQTAGNQFSDAAFRLKVSMIQILMFSRPNLQWTEKGFLCLHPSSTSCSHRHLLRTVLSSRQRCCLSQTYVSNDSDENIWFDTKIEPFQEELRETQRKWFVKKLPLLLWSRVSAFVQTWTNIDELSRSQWNLVFSMTKCPPLKKY